MWHENQGESSRNFLAAFSAFSFAASSLPSRWLRIVPAIQIERPNSRAEGGSSPRCTARLIDTGWRPNIRASASSVTMAPGGRSPSSRQTPASSLLSSASSGDGSPSGPRAEVPGSFSRESSAFDSGSFTNSPFQASPDIRRTHSCCQMPVHLTVFFLGGRKTYSAILAARRSAPPRRPDSLRAG